MARVVLVFLLVVAFRGTEVLAQTHHVVGGEDGWSSDLNVGSWLAGRVFRVGDKLWFRYPAAGETIVELRSLDEFISCDITNPIRMYTDGLNHVILEKEGARYFTSGNLENCKNGMKLPVTVQTHPYGPAPPTQPEPLPPVLPVPTPPEPLPPVQPKPPKPLPPVQPTPPEPLPPVQPKPPKPLPPVLHPPPCVPTPLEPFPVKPPPAIPFPVKPPPAIPFPVKPPPAIPPPRPSAAAAPLNVLYLVFSGLLISYFGL